MRLTPAEIDSATKAAEGVTTFYDIPTLTTTQLWEAVLIAASAGGGLRLLGASRAVLGFTVAEGAADLRGRFVLYGYARSTEARVNCGCPVRPTSVV